MSSRQDLFRDLGPHDILIIGSLVSDVSCTYVRRADDGANARPRQGSSNPARITQCVGGVAHNIALAAHYLGVPVLLVSVVADDSAASFLLREVEKEGLKTHGILQLKSSEEHGEVRTGQYVGNYNHDKEFLFGMADVKLMLHPDTEVEATWRTLLIKTHPRIVVLDTTFSPKTIDTIITQAIELDARVIVEPVSQPRAKDFALTHSFRAKRSPSSQARVDMITPNAEELDAMFEGALDSGLFERDVVKRAIELEQSWLSNVANTTAESREKLKSRLNKIVLLLKYVSVIVVTFGSDGCLLAVRRDSGAVEDMPSSDFGVCACETFGAKHEGLLEYFSSPCELESTDIVSVNGAGDSLVGVVAVEWWKALKEIEQTAHSQNHASVTWSAWQNILSRGQWAALATLQHEAAVSPAIRDLNAYKDKLLNKKTHNKGTG